MLSALLNRLRPQIAAIDPADAVKMVPSGELTLIDIRNGAELDMTGRAKGAVHIPMSALRTRADPANPECHPSLSLDKPVALYCASGARSRMAARMLTRMGFKNVYNLGSLHHWKTAGGPVTR